MDLIRELKQAGRRRLTACCCFNHNKQHVFIFHIGITRRMTVGSSQMYEALIKSRADVNEPDEDSNTHLINTARGGHIKCMNVLLKAGADVNKHGKDGFTALIEAARNGNDNCV